MLIDIHGGTSCVPTDHTRISCRTTCLAGPPFPLNTTSPLSRSFDFDLHTAWMVVGMDTSCCILRATYITQVEIVLMAFLSGISIALLQEALLRALYATPPKLHITYT
jgi:hypothetical protein